MNRHTISVVIVGYVHIRHRSSIRSDGTGNGEASGFQFKINNTLNTPGGENIEKLWDGHHIFGFRRDNRSNRVAIR